MEHKLEYIGGHGYSERGYHIQPSSKLIVPIEGCLEVTLTPNALFLYKLQYVNITLSSGILTIDDCARDEFGRTQLFGFFGKDDVLKFKIRLKTEKEIVNARFDLGMWHERREGSRIGQLRVVHGGVINEEDTWKMLSNHYKDGFLEVRADWTLHPGFHRFEVHAENDKDEKVKKVEAIYKEKWGALEEDFEKDFEKAAEKRMDNFLELETKRNGPDVDGKEKNFERKNWRAENHGLKVVKLTKTVEEKPEGNENKPEKTKSEKPVSKKSEKKEKSKKAQKSVHKEVLVPQNHAPISKKSEKTEKSKKSQKSVPKKVGAETLVSQNPAPKCNRSEKVQTPRKSQKLASSVKPSSKETVTKTEITQNTTLKSSAEPGKVANQEKKKKKKNPCCSIL